MDRTLKERIIGAVVLVVFVVLVVPIFLDGPPGQSEVVTENVKLPGQASQKMQTQVLDRNRSTPVPGSSDSKDQPAADAPKPRIVAVKDVAVKDKEPERTDPAPEPKVVSAAPPKTDNDQSGAAPEVAGETSTTGMWAVQLGSFSDQANAEKLAADLRERGYAAFLSKLSTQKGQLHRVRIGPQADREAAASVADKLATEGHKGQVVPHP